MSYSLFLHFKPRLRHADMLGYFARRRHYRATKDRVSYENEDTGVNFWFKPQLGWDLLLRRTVKSLEFEVNYNRPSFFGLEAEQELSAFVGAFNPRIEDPQMEGMGEGPYSRDGFLRGWNFGNRFAISQTAPEGSDRQWATMPAAELRATWEWNYRCAEQREKRNLQSYVASILFWRIEGRVCRVAAWGESMPILLPRVDYVVVAREAAGKVTGALVAWSDIVELANRAGFDTGKEPLELRYLTPPPLIADWAAKLRLTDLKAYERLPAHEILDEELIPVGRRPTARDQPPRPPADPPNAPPSFDQTPDMPRAFGYKTSWFAIKTDDPAAVIAALEFGAAAPANWATGIEAAYGSGAWENTGPWVFVSPPVKGWVLAVSSLWPYPVTIEANRDIGERFDLVSARLMQRFEDVQFFGSHRVVDFVTWARALKGKPIRMFGYAGSEGEVLANFGAQTPEEAQLKFANLSGLSPADATERMFVLAEEENAEIRVFPEESDVVELAGLWSIDPSQLEEQDHPPGLGLAVRLPENLKQ